MIAKWSHSLILNRESEVTQTSLVISRVLTVNPGRRCWSPLIDVKWTVWGRTPSRCDLLSGDFCRDFDVVEPTEGPRPRTQPEPRSSSEHNHPQALIAPPRRRQAIGRHQARRQELPHSFVACGSDDEILKSMC